MAFVSDHGQTNALELHGHDPAQSSNISTQLHVPGSSSQLRYLFRYYTPEEGQKAETLTLRQ